MLAKYSKITGNKGEDLAKEYLIKKSYKIIHQNKNFSNQEIDLIAKKGKNYFIIEVKTSSQYSIYSPEDYITPKKLINLKKAAYYFSRETKISLENIYFDLIAVSLNDGGESTEIKHYRDIC